jgi:hypothetical protein
MTGLTLGEVTVVEVQIPDEGAIIEGRPVWSCTAEADKGAGAASPEVPEVLPDPADRLAPDRPEGTAQRVEDAGLELPPDRLIHIFVTGSDDVLSEFFRPGHEFFSHMLAAERRSRFPVKASASPTDTCPGRARDWQPESTAGGNKLRIEDAGMVLPEYPCQGRPCTPSDVVDLRGEIRPLTALGESLFIS